MARPADLAARCHRPVRGRRVVGQSPERLSRLLGSEADLPRSTRRRSRNPRLWERRNGQRRPFGRDARDAGLTVGRNENDDDIPGGRSRLGGGRGYRRRRRREHQRRRSGRSRVPGEVAPLWDAVADLAEQLGVAGLVRVQLPQFEQRRLRDERAAIRSQDRCVAGLVWVEPVRDEVQARGLSRCLRGREQRAGDDNRDVPHGFLPRRR